jgi:hypothetical protein
MTLRRKLMERDRRDMRFRLAFLCGLLFAPRAAAADPGSLPADPRLAPVRADLEKTMAVAAHDGLPADMIASKVREGLAKGVAPEVIRDVAGRLAQNLGASATLLRAQRAGTPSPSLVRAVAEARMAGVDPEAIAPLAASREPDAVVVRAVAVVTDLTVRGYPSRPSASLVREIADRDTAALGRVVAGLESIRTEQTVSRADALEALGRNFRSHGASLDTALARSLESGDRAGGAGADSPGKSAEAPGHTGLTGSGKPKKPKK